MHDTQVVDIIMANKDELVALLVKEQGKPLAHAGGELGLCVAKLKQWIDLRAPVGTPPLHVALASLHGQSSVVCRCNCRNCRLSHRSSSSIHWCHLWNHPLELSPLLQSPKMGPSHRSGQHLCAETIPIHPTHMLASGRALEGCIPAWRLQRDLGC